MSNCLAKCALALCAATGVGVAYSDPVPADAAHDASAPVCVAGSGPDAKTRARAKLAQRLVEERSQAIVGRERMVSNELLFEVAAISSSYSGPNSFRYYEVLKDKQVFSCAALLK